MSVLAGVASRKITPPLGEWMGGYFGREHGCTGVIEDLFLNALYIEDSEGRALVLVGADLLFFPKAFTHEIRQQLSLKWPGRRFTVLLNASHTHCGPDTSSHLLVSPGPRRSGEKYLRFLREVALSAILQAHHERRPMTLARRTVEARFSMNRRLIRDGVCRFAPDPDGPVDPRLTVWSLHDRNQGSPSIVWFSYSCHPTTHAGYLLSPDWPGIARKHIQQALGTGTTALFTQGTCGEIRPPWTPGQPGIPEQAELMGKRMAGLVVDSLSQGETIQKAAVRATDCVISLPFSSWPPEEDLRLFEAEEVDLDWCRKRLPIGAFLLPSSVDPHGQTSIRRLWAAHMRRRRESGDWGQPLGLGATLVEFKPGLRLLALEGEICFDLAQQIRHRTSQPDLQILGYTNDAPAYIPSERILREGGYEGSDAQIYFGQPSAFTPGIEDRLVDGIAELSQRLNPCP